MMLTQFYHLISNPQEVSGATYLLIGMLMYAFAFVAIGPRGANQ
jgi:hypothetical protein